MSAVSSSSIPGNLITFSNEEPSSPKPTGRTKGTYQPDLIAQLRVKIPDRKPAQAKKKEGIYCSLTYGSTQPYCPSPKTIANIVDSLRSAIPHQAT